MSDGKQVTIRGLSDHEEARLLRLRRKMSRQHKGSRRRETTKRQIGRVRAREVNRRKDTVEKLTTHLAENYDLIRIENLRIGDMVRSAKGTVERPGKNVNQKRGMNRGILRSGWGMFAQRLEDKAPGRVERIHPTNTSRRCAVCDHVAEGNRKSQAVFLCVSCGHRDNADVNAAKNIAAGHAVTARGGPKVGPLNREPRSLSVEGDRNPPSGEDVKLIADDHLCSVVT
jgi:transposase